MTDWVILRCSPSRTLALAASLAEAGFECWIPTEMKKPDPPASGPAVLTPLIHSFVFTKANHLEDLLALVHSPTLNYRVWDSEKRRMVTKGHPTFCIFRHLGEYKRIPDSALAGLRAAERRKKPRGAVKTFHVGDKVKLVEGGWAGLSGVVVATKGKKAVVSFPGCSFVQDATIGMWLLLEDDACASPSVNVDRVGYERKRALRHRNAAKVPGAESPLWEDRFLKSA